MTQYVGTNAGSMVVQASQYRYQRNVSKKWPSEIPTALLFQVLLCGNKVWLLHSHCLFPVIIKAKPYFVLRSIVD
jgi:hypothetical protein